MSMSSGPFFTPVVRRLIDGLSFSGQQEGGNRGGRQIEEASSKDPNALEPPVILAC